MARSLASDHSEKRDRILRIAAQHFARDGIDGASMAQVAKASGMSKANVYHYYPSKQALLFGILDNNLNALASRLSDLPKDGPVATRLHDFTREVLLAYEGMNDEHKLQMDGLPRLAPEDQNTLKAYQRDSIQVLEDILVELSPVLERRELLRQSAMSVFGMLNWYFMWQPNADRHARVEYAAFVADMTMNGLKTDG